MFGPSSDILELYQSIERLTGPLTEELPFGERDAWWLRGSWRGQPARIAIATMKRQLRGVVYTAPLAGRRIKLSVRDRGRNLVLGVPEVRTADAEFDRELVVNGWPAEVIQAALDPATRRVLLDGPRGMHSWMDCEDGTLFLQRGLGSGVPAPDEIAGYLDFTNGLAGRLAGAFDGQVAAIAQAQGPAAAERWVAGLAELERQRADRRSKSAALILGCIAAIIVGGILLVVVLIVIKTASR